VLLHSLSDISLLLREQN